MKKLCRYFIKYPAFIASMAAVISVSLAIVSQCNAAKVFDYTKKLNKASVSLLDTNVEMEYFSIDSIRIKFLFDLSNTGNEPLSILSASTAAFNFKDNIFKNIYTNDSIINTLHPGAIFNSRASILIIHLDGIDRSPEYLLHDIAVMMKIKYTTQSITDSVTFYIKCDKLLNIHHLSRAEYELMKPFLPEEFRLDS